MKSSVPNIPHYPTPCRNQCFGQIPILTNSKKIFSFGILVILLSLACAKSYSQISGTGCDFGGRIAMQYLGTATYYGNRNDIVQVYSFYSAVFINKGNGRGYDCTAVNDYAEFRVWDPSIKPYGGMVTVPASHDIRRSSSSRPHECVVATSRFGIPYGEGTLVGYTYKDPNKCSGTRPAGLPLDSYLPFVMILTGMIALPVVRKI